MIRQEKRPLRERRDAPRESSLSRPGDFLRETPEVPESSSTAPAHRSPLRAPCPAHLKVRRVPGENPELPDSLFHPLKAPRSSLCPLRSHGAPRGSGVPLGSGRDEIRTLLSPLSAQVGPVREPHGPASTSHALPRSDESRRLPLLPSHSFRSPLLREGSEEALRPLSQLPGSPRAFSPRPRSCRRLRALPLPPGNSQRMPGLE